MTAWAEPVGAIATASRHHPTLCFVLAGVEVSNEGFTSHFMHRGRVRSWEMSKRRSPTYAELEQDEETGEEYLAGYQPRIMQALLDHWDSAVTRTLKMIGRTGSLAPRLNTLLTRAGESEDVLSE